MQLLKPGEGKSRNSKRSEIPNLKEWRLRSFPITFATIAFLAMLANHFTIAARLGYLLAGVIAIMMLLLALAVWNLDDQGT